MKQEPERSESGAPIFHHKARERGFELAHGDEETIEKIGAHIETHVGRIASVYHELMSDLVHIDVYMIEPTEERNFFTLVTSGMSDKPMAAPEGYEDCGHTELVICLPPHWSMTQEAFQDDANYWPIRWLKLLARLPHEYKTWLYASHTVPNGDPALPFAPNTKLCCALLLRPTLFDDAFKTLELSAEKRIEFLSVVPLYRGEMELKLDEGLDALLELLDDAGVTELLDIKRENVSE